jgi:60 kDa SS-A/Ro ribonucleoprotein
MGSLNRLKKMFTHEGARAVRIDALAQLERSVMSCLLWESEFYEDGQTIVERIAALVKQVPAEDVARVAIQAKEDMRLRHVPLLLARELMRTKEGRALARNLFPRVILRPDDITEFLAIYWKDNKDEPLAKQIKRWVGDSFRKFDEYQLAKYNGGQKAVKLRDALRVTRPKPASLDQAELWRKLVKGEMATPDTWEVELSKGGDKKATFARLMSERKLGTLAFLRNLRNMNQAGIDTETVSAYAQTARIDRILPFQFIAAARAVPAWDGIVESMMLRSLEGQKKIPGKTVLVVDTSGSMTARLSARSEMSRMDVAAALAVLARELCEEAVIYCTAGNDRSRIHATMLIPFRRGFALSDYVTGHEVRSKIGGGGIFLTQCMKHIKAEQGSADRVIVLTDEQDCDIKLNPESADAFGLRNYLINIASAKNGIGYRKWVHIDGWSDKVLDYLVKYEASARNDA